jgi:hypothetical protein
VSSSTYSWHSDSPSHGEFIIFRLTAVSVHY